MWLVALSVEGGGIPRPSTGHGVDVDDSGAVKGWQIGDWRSRCIFSLLLLLLLLLLFFFHVFSVLFFTADLQKLVVLTRLCSIRDKGLSVFVHSLLSFLSFLSFPDESRPKTRRIRSDIPVITRQALCTLSHPPFLCFLCFLCFSYDTGLPRPDRSCASTQLHTPPC